MGPAKISGRPIIDLYWLAGKAAAAAEASQQLERTMRMLDWAHVARGDSCRTCASRSPDSACQAVVGRQLQAKRQT